MYEITIRNTRKKFIRIIWKSYRGITSNLVKRMPMRKNYIFSPLQCCAKIFDQINSSLYIRVAISKRTINNIEYKAMISKEDSIIHEHYYILL